MKPESDSANSSQIFKNHIPNEVFFELLEKICFKMENCYVFSVDSFKKGLYNDEIQKFLQICNSYYFISRRHYLTRKLTYQSFATILRQICNYNKITYTKEIKYNKSTYSMFYYVFFETEEETIKPN